VIWATKKVSDASANPFQDTGSSPRASGQGNGLAPIANPEDTFYLVVNDQITEGDSISDVKERLKSGLRMVCTHFGTPASVDKISVTFAGCCANGSSPSPTSSIDVEYRGVVDEFRREVTAVAPIQILDYFSTGDLSEVQSWLSSASASLSNVCRQVEEVETGVFVEYRYVIYSRFAKRQDRKRYKFTSGTDDPPRYSEWIVTREYEEPAGQRTVQICTANRQDMIPLPHPWAPAMAYQIRWTDQWTVTTDFDGNVTTTEPIMVGSMLAYLVSGIGYYYVPCSRFNSQILTFSSR
jgi:hypothetical protein